MNKLSSLRKVIILGSTGSVGTQALDVIREQKGRFEIVGLSANWNGELLKEQAEEFGVDLGYAVLAEGDSGLLVDLVEKLEADIVLVAVSGAAGLEPTLAAIRSGKDIALANKETLVMAGDLVMEEVRKYGVKMIPVDSEHSAIFQILERGRREEIDKIILTCSGGPFLHKSREELVHVTAADALKHPTWSMGLKITIDSATLMNKGFEVIEAHHLFGLPYEQIEVRIHPQSFIHGIVQFKDGSILVNASKPDMRDPIRYTLNYPDAAPEVLSATLISSSKGTEEITLETGEKFEFTHPDQETFPGIQLATKAAQLGGEAPTQLVHANDNAVHDFLNGKIEFLEIYKRIQAGF